MVILDVSIVNVALPSIRDDLDFSTTGLQWVVNAYTLTFSGFLLLGGRASDLLGRRRVFLGGTAGVLLPLAIGVTLIGAFLWVEWRVAKAPLVPLSIFARPLLRAANVVVLLLGSALFAMWFFVSLYLQQVLHYGALKAGLGFLPMTLSIVAVSTFAARIIARIGARSVLSLGMSSAALGLLLLSGVHPGGSYLTGVLPGGELAAIGLGLSMVPVTVVGVQGVASDQSGLASGLINTSRLMGGALGLAALSTLAAAETHSAVSNGAARLQALTDGFGVAFTAGRLSAPWERSWRRPSSVPRATPRRRTLPPPTQPPEPALSGARCSSAYSTAHRIPSRSGRT
jgi:Major Facilitator Superfamily